MNQNLTYLLIFLLGFTTAQAQEVPRTLNFSKNDYQAQNQNWAMAQSPTTGEIFVGNGAGLLVFDGANWRTLLLPNQQIVRSVACDGNGRVYVGGFAEFGYWERQGWGDYRYTSLSKDVAFEKVKTEEIWHILVENTEGGKNATPTVFFQSFSTLYKFENAKTTAVVPPYNVMFLQTVGGRLLLPVLQRGLFELTADNQFQLLPDGAFFSNKEIAGIVPLGTSFLVGTKRDGIFKYENNRFSAWSAQNQRISTEFQLNKLLKRRDGRLVFGTILNGVFVLDSLGNSVFHLNKENGLQNNTVLSLHEDAAQNLWLGLDKGIDLVDLNTPLRFFQDKTGKIGAVYAAAIFNQKLYVGTNQGLFWRYQNPSKNTTNGTSSQSKNPSISKSPNLLISQSPFQLVKGSQGQVWDLQVIDNQLICGHNGGTFIVGADNSFRQISSVTGGWQLIKSSNWQAGAGFSKASDSTDLLLQGTYIGIALFQKNKAGDWQFWKKINGFGQPTKKLAFDKNGTIWALNPYGQVFQLGFEGDSVKIRGQFEGKFDLAPFDSTVVFTKDQNHFIFDKNQLGKTNLPTGNYKIKQGRGGEWFKIHPDFVELLRGGFETPTVLQKLRLKLNPNQETIIPLDDTHYLFGLDDGFAVFDPQQTFFNQTVSPQPIVRVHTDDGQAFHFYKNSPTERLPLPPQYHHLKIDCALPHFTEGAQFSYFLSNYSKNWSVFEPNTRRDFSNLKAGNYEFRLKNDITNEETVVFFEIQPFWYETFWAMLLYLAVFILGIVWLKKYHDRQLNRQKQQLEADKQRALEEERIKSDNEKLHLDVLNKSTELANSAMGIVRKNEVLMDIRQAVERIKKETLSRTMDKNWDKLIGLIDDSVANDASHQIFEDNFNEVHQDFLPRLKAQFPELTPGDLKLAAYLRMNLTSKEISPLLYISLRGVENKRYRLRKKMSLSDEVNLTEFLIGF